MLRNVCWIFATLLLLASPVWAEHETNKPEPQSAADLVKQLDAESFSERQAASAELAARGKEALPALSEAAQGESTEAATRALDILRKHHEAGDADLKAAAKETLQKLASGDGAVARRAAEVLTPKPMPIAPAVPPRLGLRPGIRIEPGMRIAVAGGGIGGGQRVTFKDVNGVKEIEVVEGERTTRIEEDPAKSIKVKITEKKDGKDETKEYEAKNAEELKEKHPEAHKIYEQYAKGAAGGFRIEGLRIGVAPGFGGGELRRLEPPAIIREPRALVERLDKVQKQLEEAVAKLKKIAEGADNADEVRAAIESIEASKKELDQVKAQFPLR